MFSDSLVPVLLEGALSIDDRGSLAFINGFNPAAAGVRRLYLTQNHRAGFVRAWHGHKKETKYVMAVSGSALVCAVEVRNWEPRPHDCDRASEVHRFVLSAVKPAVLYIPPGYANGWMSLNHDCRLLWFSTATLDASRMDDVRFPVRYWNPWKVEER